MKRIWFFIFGIVLLSVEQETLAQTLDDLFDEEDFQSSEIERMQKETAAKNEAARKKASAAPPKTASVPLQKTAASVSLNKAAEPKQMPVSVPAPEKKELPVTAAGNTPSVAKSSGESAPKTFSLFTGPRTIQTGTDLPQLGSRSTASLPALGKNTEKKAEEPLSLFEMRAQKTGYSDTNVLDFDIAGVQLKMSPEEVIQKAEESGFSIKLKDWKIPDPNEWKYHRQCLQQMFFAHGSKKKCIKDAAQYDNKEYINRLVFENKSRKETLSVEFTSTFTGNQAYRVRYVNKGNHSLGTTEEARYLKVKRRRDFLETLIKKYGPPDDERTLLWGLSGLNAVLQAEISNTFLDISLVMEDPLMQEKDFHTIAIKDKEDSSSDQFGF